MEQDSRLDIEFCQHLQRLRRPRRFLTRCNRIITAGISLTADAVDTTWLPIRRLSLPS